MVVSRNYVKVVFKLTLLDIESIISHQIIHTRPINDTVVFSLLNLSCVHYNSGCQTAVVIYFITMLIHSHFLSIISPPRLTFR